ncbi:hypothetical protein ACHAWO_008957 [Cyclotella atomus]|uniref:Uncharacterized protein n=1 Tax=Cyclotella atomus TaxID=382360 RepID=A0ABD3QJE2_9STRA
MDIKLTLNEVTEIDAIGLEIWSFLHPKDLCNFSLTDQLIHKRICDRVIQLASQLPFILDEQEVEYEVKVSKEHSFPTRNNLLDHVLHKIEAAELKFPGQTPEESLIIAEEVLNREKKPGIYGATFMSETSRRFPDPEITHVGYNYQKENRASAADRCNDILERMSAMKHATVVKFWMDYLFANPRIVVGSWFWTCRHRLLDFQGVEGKGIMFSFPETNEQLELQCIIMTRGKVGEDDDDGNNQIIPQNCHDEEDVYAVPNPYMVTPQEQSGVVASVQAFLVDDDDLVIDGDAVVIIEDQTREKPRSLLGLLKTKRSRLRKTRPKVSRELTNPSEDRNSSLTSSRSPPDSSLHVNRSVLSSSDYRDIKQRINVFRS